jgi:hypothetical protein
MHGSAHVDPVPLHALGAAHAGGVLPSAKIVHTPSDVAPADAAHASQAPAHALLQHTPSAQ